MKINSYHSDKLTKEVITTKKLHKGLELDFNDYQEDIRQWFSEHYGFREEIRQPVEGKDFAKINTTNRELYPDFEITIELAKLITLNSRSKLKHQYAQWPLELERKKNNLELLTVEQVVFINKLIQFFGFISNQKNVLKEHKDKYVKEKSNKGRTPQDLYAFFHNWRNSKLDISRDEVNERLKEYCIKNQKSVDIANKSKFEQIFVMDNYETLKHAVWDFMHVNDKQEMALKVSEITYEIAKRSGAPLHSRNENSLFQRKIETQLRIK